MDIVVITDVAAIVVVIVVLVLITTYAYRYPHAYQQAQACNQVEKAQEHTLQAQALS